MIYYKLFPEFIELSDSYGHNEVYFCDLDEAVDLFMETYECDDAIVVEL